MVNKDRVNYPSLNRKVWGSGFRRRFEGDSSLAKVEEKLWEQNYKNLGMLH